MLTHSRTPALCPDGTSTAGDKATDHDSIGDCIENIVCLAGTELLEGATECSPCSAGSYKAEATEGWSTQPPCLPCEAGRFTRTAGNAACEVCPAGTIATSEASTRCTKCASGTYLEDDAHNHTYHDEATDCVPCSVGAFSPLKGRTEPCDTCEAGHVAVAEGSSECASCPSGRHLEDDATDPTLHDDRNDCVLCDEGLISSDDRSSCDRCAPGTEPSANRTRYS